MLSGDRLFCIFVENHPESGRFNDWPLHITLVPWFRAEIATTQVSAEVTDKIKGTAPFTLQVEGEAGFGYRGRKAVNLIKQPSPLTSVEKQIRRVLHAHRAWLVDETTKKSRAFRPHITIQKSGRVREGDIIQCDSLYIVEQKGEYKEIVSKIYL